MTREYPDHFDETIRGGQWKDKMQFLDLATVDDCAFGWMISGRKVLEAGEPEKTGIPRGAMDLVRDGAEDAEGNVLWKIISGIRACGYDVEEIWDIVATEPNGIAKGYGERLRAEVESVYAKLQKIDDNKSGPRDDEQREGKRPNGGEGAKRDFEARVGTGVAAGAGAGRRQRFKLTPFDQIKMNTASDCVIEGIIPKGGFVVMWGPPKCGKSFVAFDWAMHVALGRLYRGHYVEQGAVIYCALEGGGGFGKRKEAWARGHADDLKGRASPPFYLLNVPIALVADQNDLIAAIEAQAPTPSVVVIDTLNRALGDLDENSGGDMGKLIKAADAIRYRFGCAVVIIHHCGVDGTRPRGHTSLSGAYDALIAVTKSDTGLVKVTVENMRDDEPIDPFYCRLERVDLGENDRGAGLHSCVVVPTDHTGAGSAGSRAGKVNANQQRFLDILAEAIYDAPPAHKIKENIPGGRTAISRMWLKMCCHTKGWLDPETSDNRQRAKLSDTINALAGKRLIGATDRYVWDARV